MLILTRNKFDAILVDGDIAIQVLDVRGKQVQLGISAPPDVEILRTELLSRKDQKAVARQLRPEGAKKGKGCKI